MGLTEDYIALVMKAPYKAKETNAADPMANPLPIAAVVLPAASKASVNFLISGSNSAIVAIPPALSEIGPYTSIANPTAKVDNIPIAAKATPNMPNNLIATKEVKPNKIIGTMVDK